MIDQIEVPRHHAPYYNVQRCISVYLYCKEKQNIYQNKNFSCKRPPLLAESSKLPCMYLPPAAFISHTYIQSALTLSATAWYDTPPSDTTWRTRHVAVGRGNIGTHSRVLPLVCASCLDNNARPRAKRGWPARRAPSGTHLCPVNLWEARTMPCRNGETLADKSATFSWEISKNQGNVCSILYTRFRELAPCALHVGRL